MKIDDNLTDVFDLEPAPVLVPDVVTSTGDIITADSMSMDENIDFDYAQTRNNLHSLLTQGQEALMHALDVAKSSESPRAFEVVSTLIGQLADVNHRLLDLSEKRIKISTPDAPARQPSGSNVTNNAIFVGSTTDLNKMLKQALSGE